MSVPPVRYPLSGVSGRQRVSVQPLLGTDLSMQCPSAHITAQERRPRHACSGSRLWHQKTRAQVLTPIVCQGEPLHSFSFPRISVLPCKGGFLRPPFCAQLLPAATYPIPTNREDFGSSPQGANHSELHTLSGGVPPARCRPQFPFCLLAVGGLTYPQSHSRSCWLL